MIQLVPIVLAQVALLGGGPVSVQCQIDPSVAAAYPNMQIDGLAYESQRMMQIRPGLCAAANDFSVKPTLPKGPKPGSANFVYTHAADEAWSLLVLAHEANHIAHPDLTEEQVNCLASSESYGFARVLGADPRTAARIRAIDGYLTRMQPKEYRSACAANGSRFKIKTPRDSLIH